MATTERHTAIQEQSGFLFLAPCPLTLLVLTSESSVVWYSGLAAYRLHATGHAEAESRRITCSF